MPKVRRTPTVDSQPGKRCTEQDTPDSMASGWIRIKARDGKCDDHLRVNSAFSSGVRITRETYLKNSTRPPSDARCQTARLPPASITPKINESLSIKAFYRSTLNDRGKKTDKHAYRLIGVAILRKLQSVASSINEFIRCGCRATRSPIWKINACTAFTNTMFIGGMRNESIKVAAIASTAYVHTSKIDRYTCR